MKTIPLTKGFEAMVDDADYDWLMQWKWLAQYSKRRAYAARTAWNGKTSTIYMHKLITGIPSGQKADHRDGNTLNNQRYNLRAATTSQNGMNQRLSSVNTSGFKGVCWNGQSNQWMAYIKLKGKFKNLGLYENPIDAAMEYDSAAVLHFGEFALTNKMLGLLVQAGGLRPGHHCSSDASTQTRQSGPVGVDVLSL